MLFWFTRLFLTCSRVWLKLLWVGHAIICTILDTLFCATPDSMFIVEMFVLRRRLAEEDPSSNEAETLGWRLARLFVRWRLFVEMCVLQRRLAAENPSSNEAVALALGWRLARLFVRWRWFVEMCKLRRAAVARVVLQRRLLDAATINHVLSYLSTR